MVLRTGRGHLRRFPAGARRRVGVLALLAGGAQSGTGDKSGYFRLVSSNDWIGTANTKQESWKGTTVHPAEGDPHRGWVGFWQGDR